MKVQVGAGITCFNHFLALDDPAYYLLWIFLHNPTCSKKGCSSVSPLILVVSLWTSGKGNWIIGLFILINIHKNATANAPHNIKSAPSLQRGPWSRFLHTFFPVTSFSTILRTLSAAWHAWDFVRTPYELKQSLSLSDLDSQYLAHLCNANDILDEQHILFHSTHPNTASLHRGWTNESVSSSRCPQHVCFSKAEQR